jgi:hypothetical protein
LDARSKDAEEGSKLRLVFEKQDLALNFKAGRDVLCPPPEREFSAVYHPRVSKRYYGLIR